MAGAGLGTLSHTSLATHRGRSYGARRVSERTEAANTPNVSGWAACKWQTELLFSG
jgi:hypothetical protein